MVTHLLRLDTLLVEQFGIAMARSSNGNFTDGLWDGKGLIFH